jgi:hypothetical protein
MACSFLDRVRLDDMRDDFNVSRSHIRQSPFTFFRGMMNTTQATVTAVKGRFIRKIQRLVQTRVSFAQVRNMFLVSLTLTILDWKFQKEHLL